MPNLFLVSVFDQLLVTVLYYLLHPIWHVVFRTECVVGRLAGEIYRTLGGGGGDRMTPLKDTFNTSSNTSRCVPLVISYNSRLKVTTIVIISMIDLLK